jgi:hypothetical protein
VGHRGIASPSARRDAGLVALAVAALPQALPEAPSGRQPVTIPRMKKEKELGRRGRTKYVYEAPIALARGNAPQRETQDTIVFYTPVSIYNSTNSCLKSSTVLGLPKMDVGSIGDPGYPSIG